MLTESVPEGKHVNLVNKLREFPRGKRKCDLKRMNKQVDGELTVPPVDAV